MHEDREARTIVAADSLNRAIVASAGFAGICVGGWADLGEFPTAGFSRAERVYALLDESPLPGCNSVSVYEGLRQAGPINL